MCNKYSLVFLLLSVFPDFGPGLAIAETTDTETVDRGRYLVIITGCNDCHTPGYLASAGRTPEDLWLTGDTFGWRGPWGTTYGANLRMVLRGLSEDQWVKFAQTMTARPPMPWFNLNQMKNEDLRAMYRYIRQLGPEGKPAPAYVPPDEDPDPPYALFPPPMPSSE